MAKQKIRIRLKAYDHRVIDQSAEKIVETAKRFWCRCFWTNSITNRKISLYNYSCCA